MALTQIFPITAISGPVGGNDAATKRWPAGAEAIRFQLDDAQFTDPAKSIQIRMELSWNNKATWPNEDRQLWFGGAKARDGSPPSVTLGPFKQGDVIMNPTHVRFSAQPGPGSPTPVNVGLKAEITEE